MRLWPYQMIPYLPYKHLLGQWREVLAVSGMYSRGEINHCIIDRVKDHSVEHLAMYVHLVENEMKRRDYKVGENALEKLKRDIGYPEILDEVVRVDSLEYDEQGECPMPVIRFYHSGVENSMELLFDHYHDRRYLLQCLLKFQEFHDCQALNNRAWGTLRLPFLATFPNVDLT